MPASVGFCRARAVDRRGTRGRARVPPEAQCVGDLAAGRGGDLDRRRRVAGPGRGESVAVALRCAFVVPLVLWNGTMGLIVYLHHTHPDVAWHDDRKAWQREGAPRNAGSWTSARASRSAGSRWRTTCAARASAGSTTTRPGAGCRAPAEAADQRAVQAAQSVMRPRRLIVFMPTVVERRSTPGIRDTSSRSSASSAPMLATSTCSR